MKKDRTYILSVFDKITQKIVTDVRDTNDFELLETEFEIDGIKDMFDYLNHKLDDKS